MKQADLDLLEQAGLVEVTASHGERREYRIKSGAESLFFDPPSRFDVLEAEYLAARQLPMEEEPPRLFKLIKGGKTVSRIGYEAITPSKRRKAKTD